LPVGFSITSRAARHEHCGWLNEVRLGVAGVRQSSVLRELLKREEILVVPGVQAALFARVAEEAGFEAVYATGAGISNLQLGLPDLGLATMTEILDTVRRIVSVTSVPVIADIDDGYGSPINVYRCVREFTRAGVAALQLEDQAAPKRCGHFEGKAVISQSEMVQKIRAARDASLDDDLVLIARTDSIAPCGLEEALERAQAYGEAGADLIFVEAPETMEQLELLPHRVGFPLVANMVEGGRTPLLSSLELECMGYKMVLFANATLKSAVKGVQRVLEGLRTHGSTAGLGAEMISMELRNELTDLRRFEKLEREYGNGLSERRRYTKTEEGITR
jgi:2-methylisocitrate lyase-like PEP mutase family enzyme